MKKLIVINTSFIALHNWPNCNIEAVSFLRNTHRHVFHVKVKFEVIHSNREIEFINRKVMIDKYIRAEYVDRDLGATSCEMIAEDILTQFGADYVSVFEDNENGAEVYAN